MFVGRDKSELHQRLFVRNYCLLYGDNIESATLHETHRRTLLHDSCFALSMAWLNGQIIDMPIFRALEGTVAEVA